MLSKWPIREKLLTGLGLLLVIVATLSWGGIRGLYGCRALVKNLDHGVNSRLVLATELNQQVEALRAAALPSSAAANASGAQLEKPISGAYAPFHRELAGAGAGLQRFREHVAADVQERAALDGVAVSLERISQFDEEGRWPLGVADQAALAVELERLRGETMELPGHLQPVIKRLGDEAREEYRALMIVVWATSASAALLLALFVKLSYDWIFRPLRLLIKGSRKVASGQFGYRIRLDSRDEMAELADALNDMTARFQAIRDDLDRQVQLRTKQVVRSEQLASVGFLAAGVAHEINNPLASIALCAESLESRVQDALSVDDSQHDIIRNYLRMIQDEAFRCKAITEQLLDFSRLGDTKRETTDLRELLGSVIEMLGHLGKYRNKRIELVTGEHVLAAVNPQQIKQVALNLLANALDSVDDGGLVTVELAERQGLVELTVRDDGCGMTEEVLEHLFEPFFTRRRSGQGTGLGLSIVYRIVSDHDGAIDAHSDGPGKGAAFHVRLPAAVQHESKESRHHSQAA